MADAGNTVAITIMLKLSHDDVIVTVLTEDKLDEIRAELEYFS
jgi:hypothetical protein